MTSKEKDFINNLAREVLKLKRERLDDYITLDTHITRLYILIAFLSLALVLISFK